MVPVARASPRSRAWRGCPRLMSSINCGPTRRAPPERGHGTDRKRHGLGADEAVADYVASATAPYLPAPEASADSARGRRAARRARQVVGRDAGVPGLSRARAARRRTRSARARRAAGGLSARPARGLSRAANGPAGRSSIMGEDRGQARPDGARGRGRVCRVAARGRTGRQAPRGEQDGVDAACAETRTTSSRRPIPRCPPSAEDAAAVLLGETDLRRHAEDTRRSTQATR